MSQAQLRRLTEIAASLPTMAEEKINRLIFTKPPARPMEDQWRPICEQFARITGTWSYSSSGDEEYLAEAAAICETSGAEMVLLESPHLPDMADITCDCDAADAIADAAQVFRSRADAVQNAGAKVRAIVFDQETWKWSQKALALRWLAKLVLNLTDQAGCYTDDIGWYGHLANTPSLHADYDAWYVSQTTPLEADVPMGFNVTWYRPLERQRQYDDLQQTADFAARLGVNHGWLWQAIGAMVWPDLVLGPDVMRPGPGRMGFAHYDVAVTHRWAAMICNPWYRTEVHERCHRNHRFPPVGKVKAVGWFPGLGRPNTIFSAAHAVAGLIGCLGRQLDDDLKDELNAIQAEMWQEPCP